MLRKGSVDLVASVRTPEHDTGLEVKVKSSWTYLMSNCVLDKLLLNITFFQKKKGKKMLKFVEISVLKVQFKIYNYVFLNIYI